MTLVIDTDPARLDRAAIHRFLSTESSWARGIDRATVDRSLDHSLCFGAYRGAVQVGLARVVTDRATFAYLCDVFVLSAERGRGVARALMAAVMAHPDLQRLRRFVLSTRDSHGLYAAFGFTPLVHPERGMERLDADLYTRAAAATEQPIDPQGAS